MVNASGKLLEAWIQHDQLFVRPHKVLISPYDPEKHVWLVEDGGHQVFMFTNDGKKLVMTLGSRVTTTSTSLGPRTSPGCPTERSL